MSAARKTLVMGVLNVTPDSFYGPSRVAGPQAALARAQEMVRDGADILDVGGESSRPGSDPVDPEEELQRIVPVFEALRGQGFRLSIDTNRAETARRALALGATMVNDITGLRGDPRMTAVVAESGCECVIMHMQGDPKTMQSAPQYIDVIGDICRFFEERLEFACKAGITENRIWLDPGFGFGKNVGHNLTVLRRLAEFKRFGRPVLVGTSNKSTIGAVLDLPPEERLEGTAATVALAIANGADAVRMHDVRAMARVARMTDAILGRTNHG
jgi:dihydropteroate synthase